MKLIKLFRGKRKLTFMELKKANNVERCELMRKLIRGQLKYTG